MTSELQYLDTEEFKNGLKVYWQRYLDTTQDPSPTVWQGNPPLHTVWSVGLRDEAAPGLRFNSKQCRVRDTPMVSNGSVIIDNKNGKVKGDTKVSLSFTKSQQSTTSHTLSHTLGTKLSFGASFIFVNFGIDLTYEFNSTEESTKSQESSQTFKIEHVVPCPPVGKIYEARISYVSMAVTVPYFADIYISGYSSTVFNPPVLFPGTTGKGHHYYYGTAAQVFSNYAHVRPVGAESDWYGVAPGSTELGVYSIPGTLTGQQDSKFEFQIVDITGESESEEKDPHTPINPSDIVSQSKIVQRYPI